MRHKKKRYLPRKCGPPRSKSYCATIRNATKHGQFCHFRLLLATSKERFLMRHKKKRYLSRKCGPPRSKSYCATRRNATKRGQFCHFGLFAGQLVGSPRKLPKTVRFLNLPYKEFISAGTTSILEFLAFRAFISGAFGGLQGAILNAPQEETLLTTEMRPSKEQIVLCHNKKGY